MLVLLQPYYLTQPIFDLEGLFIKFAIKNIVPSKFRHHLGTDFEVGIGDGELIKILLPSFTDLKFNLWNFKSEKALQN